jgi:hypothetical protein
MENNMSKILWNENFKIRIANSSEIFQKHEVVKLLLVMKLIEKNKKDKNWLRIYTEFEVMEGIICDVYIENVKKREAFAYEIQKVYTPKWLSDKTEQYKMWEVYNMDSADFIPINLNECPDTINEISKWLDKFIF